MRGRQVNKHGPITKGTVELNHCIRGEQKDVRYQVVGDRQGLSEKDEYKINHAVEDANNGSKELVQPQAVLQQAQRVANGRPSEMNQGVINNFEAS